MLRTDAIAVLEDSLKYYDPYPEIAVEAMQRQLKYAGRVHYLGDWMSLGSLKKAVPIYKSASEVELRFFGGPPKDRRYRHGNLLEMVKEICLWNIHTGDTKELTGKFLKGLRV